MAHNYMFENKTTLNDAVVNHLIERSLKTNKSRNRYRILVFIAGILALGVAIFFAIVNRQFQNMTGVMTTAALFVISFYCFYTFWMYSPAKEIEKYQKKHGEGLKLPRHIRVFKSKLEQTTSKGRADYEIDQISGFETFDHFFLLRYGNGYIILDRDGFTKGSPEEFEKYIRSRMMIV